MQDDSNRTDYTCIVHMDCSQIDQHDRHSRLQLVALEVAVVVVAAGAGVVVAVVVAVELVVVEVDVVELDTVV